MFLCWKKMTIFMTQSFKSKRFFPRFEDTVSKRRITDCRILNVELLDVELPNVELLNVESYQTANYRTSNYQTLNYQISKVTKRPVCDHRKSAGK